MVVREPSWSSRKAARYVAAFLAGFHTRDLGYSCDTREPEHADNSDGEAEGLAGVLAVEHDAEAEEEGADDEDGVEEDSAGEGAEGACPEGPGDGHCSCRKTR